MEYEPGNKCDLVGEMINQSMEYDGMGVPRQKRIDQQSRYGIRAAVAQDGQTEPGLTDESSKPTAVAPLVGLDSFNPDEPFIAITPRQVPISIYQEGHIFLSNN
jgi:hypothetical protein